ncbi:hypothetical protein [Chitinophaga arvensicola]|uniref:PKD domain-containing protein n=1 Tax=Chitinophaga arvensicola TaxID=29529 RepID=A0A1I0SA15_9BACT|nr:hypothetical protein [Chitinophaga arvensicola]SEW53140.1 hypothetical protein SAMN04488122_5351 [Chitinophaga arvensicola]
MPLDNGQGETPFSFYYLDICCHQIQLKFNSKPIQEWTNTDYLRLKDVLLQQTDVAISPNTLKRIFGKLRTSSRYYPQKATRDALAAYIDYPDWESFVAVHAQKEKAPAIAEEIQPPAREAETWAPAKPGRPAIQYYGLAFTGLLIIIMIIFLVKSNLNGLAANNPQGKVHLICQNPEGETTPRSVVFRLEVPPGINYSAEQFSIDFGDGKPVKKIRPGELMTHYYEVPGRYYTLLKYKQQPLDTLPVYLKTAGWTATAFMPTDTTRVYPIEHLDILPAGAITVNTANVYHSGIDTGHTFYVDFINARPLAVSADNFELTVTGQTSENRPGVRCSQMNVTVYGEKTRHWLVVMKPGCEAFINAGFADWLGDGLSTDMSALSADLTKGGTIRLSIIDKKVTIFINEKEVLKTAYQQPAGNIYGVAVRFSGIGKIGEVTLKNLLNQQEIPLLASTESR